MKEEQEEAEPLQIKEEQEELCPSHEGEQLLIRQKTDFLISDHKNSEPNSNQLHSHNSALSVLKGQITEYTDEIKPYTCNGLGKRVSHSSLMKYDKRTHTGEKLYSCTICEKRFSRKSNLLSHMRTHTGEKPYSCTICEKSFSQHGSMVIHMRTHTGEKPYHCNTCQKRFTQKTHLLSHMTTHTGEKLNSWDIVRKFKFRGFDFYMRTHKEKLYTFITLWEKILEMCWLKVSDLRSC